MLILISLSCVNAYDSHENDNNTISIDKTDEILTVGDDDFTALDSEIKSATNTTIKLNHNYTYNSTRDTNFTNGIVINKSITIDGQGYTLNGNGLARILYVNASNVVLKNIVFTKGYTSNSGGSGVYWNGDYGNMINCTFIQNNANIGNGAGIYWNGNNGTLNDTRFESNTAQMAGGVCWFGKSGNVDNCTFWKNTGMLWGSFYGYECDININNCNFTGNSVNWGNGGAIYFVNTTGNITNTYFESNSVPALFGNCKGGAICLWSPNYETEIINCTFKSNAAKSGSSIYSDAVLKLINSTFADSTNSQAVYNVNSLYLNNNTLKNNSIMTVGNITSPATLTIFNSTGSVGSKTTLSGRICDDNNNTVVVSRVEFIIDGENITATFNASGIFSGVYSVSSVKNHTISINSTDNLVDLTVINGTLTVNKGNLTINIEINDAVYPSALIIINSAEDGVYNVSVGDFNTQVSVLNNTGNTTITDLDAGNHTVFVSFEGDDNYYSAKANETFKVLPANNTLNVVILNVTYPNQATAVINASVDGKYTLTVNNVEYNVTVSNNIGEISLNVLKTDTYEAVLTFNNTNYVNTSNKTSFSVKKAYVIPTVTISNNYASTATITVEVVNATGDVEINSTVYNNTFTLENSTVTFKIPDLSQKDYNITVTYKGDDNYNISSLNVTFTVNPSIISSDIKRGYNSGCDFTATFYNSTGELLKNASVQFKINLNIYNITTDSNGTAVVNIKLEAGTYIVTSINPYTSEEMNNTLVIVKSIQSNNNINMYYLDGSAYTVSVYGADGNLANGVNVIFTVNGKSYTATSQNGYASLSLNINTLTPKSYTITATYNDYSVSNTITVKQVITAKKTTTIKKTAKSAKIKILLKAKSLLKKKIVKVKFKGKTYKLKTNNKGVAYFKLTKKVIKKLKKGKKYSYTITYSKDTLKRYVKIK